MRSTVIDEVMASGRSCHRQEADLRNRCLGLLEVLGLSRLADSSPYQLSGGEQRRLSIASSLAHGAVALLFDEPTVGQDRATWAAVTGAMQSAARAGAAVAVASHDVDTVEAVPTGAYGSMLELSRESARSAVAIGCVHLARVWRLRDPPGRSASWESLLNSGCWVGSSLVAWRTAASVARSHCRIVNLHHDVDLRWS